MLADIDTSQIQLTQRGGTLNREVDVGRNVREAVAKLIQQSWGNRVGMRNQQAPIVNGIRIIRQKEVREVRGYVLAAKTSVSRLFGRDRLIDPDIRTVGACRSRLKVLIVDGLRLVNRASHIRQWIIGEQRLCCLADLGRWNCRPTYIGEVSAPVRDGRNYILLKNCSATTVALIVRKEERLAM